jgi:hypothetical protein
VLIPTLVFIFFRIHYHYRDVARLLSLEGVSVDVERHPVQALILVDDVHAETVRLVNVAKSMGHPWTAVHIAVNPARVDAIRAKWNKRIGEGELVIIPSPYRLLADPLRQYIEEVRAQNPEYLRACHHGPPGDGHLLGAGTPPEQCGHVQSGLEPDGASGGDQRAVPHPPERTAARAF